MLTQIMLKGDKMIQPKRPSEEPDFEDFFDRFLSEFTDKMETFKEK